MTTLGLAAPAPGEGAVEVVPVPEFPGFAGVLGRYRLNWRSVAISLVFHAAAINLIPVLERMFPFRGEALRNVRVAAMEPLLIRVPLYAPRPARRPPGGRRGAAAKKAGGSGSGGAKLATPGGNRGEEASPAQSSEGPAGESRVVARRAFQLPPTPAPSPREQTLLQLMSPPEVKPPADLRLPQVMFWSQAPARAPRPPAKEFVMPGRSAQQARPAELTAPPRLEAPNADLRISDLKMAALEAPKPNPLLAVPPGTPMPVRSPDETAQPADVPPAVNSATGEAANVLALNPNPARLTDTIVVPPGIQISAQHVSSGQGGPGGGVGAGGGEGGAGAEGAGEGSGRGRVSGAGTGSGGGKGSGVGTGSGEGKGSGAGTGSGAGEGTGSGKESGSGRGAGEGSARGSGSGTGGGSGATGARAVAGGAGGSGSGSGLRTGAGDAGSGPGAGAAQALASMKLPDTGVPIRVVHPDNGVFDVIVQSAGGDQLSEIARVLTGRPVYTVYLRVGGPKDWILHYCVPKQPAQSTGPVIQLGSPSPLKAPFLRITVIPHPDAFARYSRTYFHGFLTPSGQFRALRPVRTEDAEIVPQLIPYLEKWDFRPATRDGKPVEVELVLVIPAAGS